MKAWIAMGVLASTAIARADGFVTLDRQDATSFFGVETSYVSQANATDLQLFRFDAHLQVVEPNGLGIYATLPFAYASGDGDSDTTIGDGELGVLYVLPRDLPDFDIVVHGGITLPIGSSEGGPVDVPLHPSFARLTDRYLLLPQATSVRVAVAGIVHSDGVFARLDVGIDANLDAHPDEGTHALVRVDAGVGVAVGPTIVMAELANTFDTVIETGQRGGSWTDVGAVSIRRSTGAFHPYAAIVFPIDHEASSELDFAITLGFDERF